MQAVVTTTAVEANYTAATEGFTSLPFGHTSLPSHVPQPVVSISINSDGSPPYLNGCDDIDKEIVLLLSKAVLWWLASCSYAITSLSA